MNGLLVLTEEQEQFREMVRQVIDRESPLSRFRTVRATQADPALWATLCGLGWPAVPFAEAQGGLGMGLVEITLLMEALGRNLATTPMLSVVMSGMLDGEAGIQEGRIVALAWQEDFRRPDPDRIACRVENGRLTGKKVLVLDAGAAEAFVVSAWEGDHLGLFRVEAAEARVERRVRLDHRDVGDVFFAGAPVHPLSATREDLQRALDHGTVALAAEMLGGAAAALEHTLAWLQQREQFDVPLGSFQALQHRAVDLFVGIELARSAVMAAAAAADAERPLLVSLAKARINDTFFAVSKEAIQMHGGIGMTDECDIGFFLKRAAVATETLGTTAWHRDRWARMHGY